MEKTVDMGNILSLANHDVRTNGVPEIIQDRFVPPYGLSILLEDRGEEIRALMLEIDQIKRDKETIYLESEAHVSGYQSLKSKYDQKRFELQNKINVEELELGYLNENKNSFVEICENRNINLKKTEMEIQVPKAKTQVKQGIIDITKSIGLFLIIEAIILVILYQFLRDTHSLGEVVIRSFGVLFLVILTKFSHSQFKKTNDKRQLYFTWFIAFLFLSSIVITLLVAFLNTSTVGGETGFSDTIDDQPDSFIQRYANLFGMMPVLLAAISLFLFPLLIQKNGKIPVKKKSKAGLKPEQQEYNRLEEMVQLQEHRLSKTKKELDDLDQKEYAERVQLKQATLDLKARLDEITKRIDAKELHLSEKIKHKEIEIESYRNCYTELLSKHPIRATVVKPFWPTKKDLSNYYLNLN